MRRRAPAVFLAAAALMGGVEAGIIDFGPVDEFTFAQPSVQVRVGSFDSWLNEYLLDTGASGILAGKSASDELAALGLRTEATYVDFGIAGPENTQVSKPYSFSFAGTDGVPITLPSVRMQTSAGNFGFISGIAGMPLMTGRTVSLNLAGQADFSVLQIGVAFGGGTAAWSAPAAHQYDVPLETRLFPATGQLNPEDPLPANAPLPFAPVEIQYGSVRRQGGFLLDTGAQQCILSRAAAFSLGLDANGNGILEDEALMFQTVAGVGGAVDIPVLRIDSLAIKAADGVDLMFRDLPVGIVDIDAAIPGVLGMNVLNSGWDQYALNTSLGVDPAGPPGAFGGVALDFRAAASGTGMMRLTVTASRDAFISQGPVEFTVPSGVQTQGQAGHAAIGGAGSITKMGLGTLVLDAVNTVTGTTTVQAGTLRIDVANALLGSPTVVQAGATLAFAPGIVARLPSIMLFGGTLAAEGTLAINGTTGVSRLMIAGGHVEGRPEVAITSGGRVLLVGTSESSLSVSSLRIDSSVGGFLDVGRGSVVIAAGGMSRAELLAGLAAGHGDGDWSGTSGIGSSAAGAACDQGVPRSVGWAEQDDGSMLVAFAAAGDANVDGLVDLIDVVNLVAGGLLGSGLTADWSAGDFNHDGVFDILDVGEFSSAGLFNQGSYRDLDFASASGDEVAAVPEPAAAAFILAGAALGLLVRLSAGTGRWRR